MLRLLFVVFNYGSTGIKVSVFHTYNYFYIIFKHVYALPFDCLNYNLYNISIQKDI